MAGLAEEVAAEAIRLGERFGVLPVPARLVRTITDGHDPGKRFQPLAKYAHLDGQRFTLELYAQLWQRGGEADALGIRAPWLVQAEADTAEGEERLRAMKLPRTWTARSPGGTKYFFRSDEPVKGYAHKGVEVKTEKTLHIVPPTPNYRWLPTLSPWEADLAAFPAKLGAPVQRLARTQPLPEVLPEGGRRGHLLSLAGAMRRKGASAGEILAALRAANEQRCRPPLGDDELQRLAGDVAARYSPAELPRTPTVRGAGGPIDLPGVRAAFTKRLLLPDTAVVDMCLAAVVAHRGGGDPLWPLLVSPPSGGKTEAIRALSGAPEVYALSSLTAQTFLSGIPGKRGASLLHRLGDAGKSFLTLKDFTTVLTLHREARAEILSQLRELYDGYFGKEFGTGESAVWEGRLGFLAGVTPAIDTHHSATAILGERFTYLRLPAPPRGGLGRRALEEAGTEAETRAELRDAVASFLSGVAIPPEPLALSPEEKDWLVALADLVTWARSAVQRDGYSRNILIVPLPEAPARFVKQLASLHRALRVMGCGEAEARALTPRVALDSCPPERLAVLRVLAEQTDELNTQTLADAVSLPTATAKMIVEDLTALRLADRSAGQGGAGGGHRWSMSEEGAALWGRAEP